METKKKILDLYEFNEEEREADKVKKKQELQKFLDKGDETEKNASFIHMKLRLKKTLADLKEQEDLIKTLQEKIVDAIGADAFFLK